MDKEELFDTKELFPIKHKWTMIISLLITMFLLPACSSEQPIDAKVSGAITFRLLDLIGETPENAEDLKPKADALLNTLRPTHQLATLPSTDYFTLTYTSDTSPYTLYFPKRMDSTSHLDLYLEGKDNGEDVYYRLKGGKYETAAIIKWFTENEKKSR